MKLTNYTPQEADALERTDPILLHTTLFLRNWYSRNTADNYWRRIHRHNVRQEIRELRLLHKAQKEMNVANRLTRIPVGWLF